MKVKKQLQALLGTLSLLIATPALAELQWNMPQGVTSVSRDVYQLHMWILGICTVIGIVVFGAILYSVVKFRKSKGVVPAQFHHSTTVEIVWTVIPLLILIGMAIPATSVLVDMYDTDESELTVKVTGYQWRWGYEYIGENVAFISVLDEKSNFARQRNPSIQPAEVGENYLLDVDKPLVLPVDTKVRFLLTANDVIHSWWVPDFGWKKDAIPGFVNEAWVRIDEEGTYRGKCAELCGRDHAFMPIVIQAVSKEEFARWLAAQKGEKPAALEEPLAEDLSEEEVVPTEEQVSAAEPTAPSGDELEEASAVLSLEQLMERGEQVYTMNCAACHGAGGEGGVGKPIAGSPIATGDLAAHVQIVVHGKAGTTMTSFGRLSDEDIAAVITFERNAFGNETGDLVQPADVGAAR